MLQTRNEIKEWLDCYGIINYTVNDDLTIDADDHVVLYKKGLTEIPVQFNNVNGYFECADNKLTSLKGCPKYTTGYFSCRGNKLKTLDYLPLLAPAIFCEERLYDTKEYKCYELLRALRQ